MGYENDPNRATKNVVFGSRNTKDKIPEDKCRTCGRRVLFDTNGFGKLVALNRTTLTRHTCAES